MAKMMRHRNKPYSCGCCYPYFDKSHRTRAYEKRQWRKEEPMNDLLNPIRISGTQPGAPPMGAFDEQDRQDESVVVEVDARRSGLGRST